MRATGEAIETVAAAGGVQLGGEMDDWPHDRRGDAPPKQSGRGTPSHFQGGREIWVVVVVRGIGKFYPQDGPVTIAADGDWTSLPVFFGDNRDAGRRFDALAVIATADAGGAFGRYLERGRLTGRYPGITRLPAGARVYDRVTVVRR